MVQASVILVAFFAGVGLGGMLAGVWLAREVHACRTERFNLLAIQEQMLDDAAAMARQGSVADALARLPGGLDYAGIWLEFPEDVRQ